MTKIKVGLLWQSLASTNMGLVALTASNMEIIRQSAASIGVEVEFVFFSARTPLGAERFMEYRSYELSSRLANPGYLHEVIKEINNCDLVFDVGEGDSFSDIYGWFRFIKIWAAKFFVRDSRSKLILSPQTIGPFKQKLWQTLAISAITRARVSFARDDLTYSRIHSIVPKDVQEKVVKAADMAFVLPVLPEWPKSFPSLSAGENIGINVSGLLYQGGYTGKNQFCLQLDYRVLIRQVIDYFDRELGCQVWLVPHVHNAAATSIESDRTVSELIAGEFKSVRVAPAFGTATEAKTFISRMDFFLGARMHATIAAVSSGVPCVPMSYSIKFEGLYRSLGYNHVLSMKALSTEEAASMIADLYNRRQELRCDAGVARDAALDRLEAYREHVLTAIRDVPSMRPQSGYAT
jgi:polysaccharide pyruvyl transferase WcaK-like protein